MIKFTVNNYISGNIDREYSDLVISRQVTGRNKIQYVCKSDRWLETMLSQYRKKIETVMED